jgi:hypothetical protein
LNTLNNKSRTVLLITTALLIVGGWTSLTMSAATKTRITIDDLSWQGTYAFPRVGDATPAGPGTTSYASGALAVRYVNGQRRFLMPTFTNLDPASGQTFGDLVEWQEPDAAPSTDADHTKAPQLIEVRRWKNWTLLGSTPSWQEKTSGVRIGGLLWDEATGVLWYQLYGYYSDRNAPVLGATKLLDTTDTGNYRTVGKQYGPWWYRNSDPTDRTKLYWKSVCNWIVRVPSSSQADLQGNSLILGGTVGAVGGAGNLGPGFRALPSLPSLSDAPNTVLPLGMRLADYTNESPVGPPHAHRDTNYQFDGVPYTASESGLYPPSNGVGFWQMSLDQVNSFIWVETATKEGILLFGRQATGMHWYGYNPRSTTPNYPAGWPDATDPSREIGPGNGYGAAGWKGALYIFDPAQVREVGRGARQPWSSGINPVAYDWRVKWPALPYESGRLIDSQISNTGFWDATAQEIIWIQPLSVSDSNPQPTLNIFKVPGGAVTTSPAPAAPTNVKIIK